MKDDPNETADAARDLILGNAYVYSLHSTRLLGSPDAFTAASSITSDGSGNTIAVGYTNGNLDGATRIGASQDSFLVKYGIDSGKRWTKTYGVEGANTQSYGITADPDGNIYASGATNGNLHGETLGGITDLFVTKFDPLGTRLWTRLSGTAGANTKGWAIAYAPEDSVYAVGFTKGNLDGQVLTGEEDLAIVKYDSSGNRSWTRTLGVTGSITEGLAVACDSNSNVYVTGFTEGNLDGQTLDGLMGIFTVKYDKSGNKLWTRLLGSPDPNYGFSRGVGIVADPLGNSYVTGWTQGALGGNPDIGHLDSVLIKYDTNGNRLWVFTYGAPGIFTESKGIARTKDGDIYVVGVANGDLHAERISGRLDSYVIRFDAEGERKWTRLFGTFGAQTRAASIAVDELGGIHVTGDTEGNLDGRPRTGITDSFFVKYDVFGTRL